ncbi:hypothetical protein ANSO36C_61510 [Nostoc cf. commune SO-36]|uniref:histidine kinase n=1 Tax=Nostoc cf. commune SO-36 TaxID=449208 RepID=A0ABN6QBY2_NOSCO|nr:PAS domain-containing protein [Nostoc commune]BDI20349.1 hypothetical protein ANSO36C_61510 [Nostoc cf. commune SO-36]
MSQQQRTLLIVDDSPEDRELYRRYLRRDREYSYTIFEATLGRQGLELWQQHQPDVILLDYRLPDLDGLEFLAQLQPLSQGICLPVIVVTGQGNEAIAVQAMKAGAQDYLVKEQISPEGLQIAVNGAIETARLRTQLQQRIERDSVISYITQQIHQSLNLDEILQTTVAEVRRFLHTDRVLVFQLKPDGDGTVIAESVGAQWRSLLSSTIYDPCLAENYLAWNPLETVTYDPAFVENYIQRYRQGYVTAIFDIQDSSIDPCHVELLAQFQVKANLVVPIIYDNHFWGLLIAHNCETPRRWQPLEIDLLKELAIQVSIAIRQAELYQQAQNELTERRRVEAELRESEERFRQIAENIDVVFWLREASENRVSYVSPAYKHLWGLNPEELYQGQQSWIDRIHPEDRELTDRAFHEKAVVGQFDEEYRIILADGSIRWVHDRCFPLRDETGEIYRFAGIAEDISERKQAEQALRNSEERLQMALEGSGGGLWDWNIITNEDYLSPRWLEMLGYEKGELPDDFSGWERLIHPDDKVWVMERLNAHLQDDSVSYKFEYQMLTKSGEWKWIANHGKVVSRDQQGNPLRMAGIHHDVTDRKQAELALRQSEEFKNRILDSSSDCIKVLSLEGRLLYMNTGGMCLMEIDDLDSYLNTEWLCFWENSDRQQAEQALAAAQIGEISIFCGYCPTVKGTPKWWEVVVSPILDASGEMERILLISRDITDRKQVEKALRQSEERYRCLAELIPQLVWTANPEGALLDANQRWLEYTGLTPEQAQTRGWKEIVHPDDVLIMAQQWSEAVQHSTSYQAQGRMRRADGVYRWHLHQAIPQKDQQGQIVKWFGSATDIEAQKQLEAERDRLFQLEQAARAEAERANRIKDEFLAILSHELRSPLNPILGWTKLLQTRKFNETKTAEALAIIERNAKLQTQLIDDLLDVAKILRGKLSINAAPVNLAFVIESAIDTVSTTAVAKSILLHPVLRILGQVSGDSNRLATDRLEFTFQRYQVYSQRGTGRNSIRASWGSGTNYRQ